ncbi:MAG: hypothetical protein LBT00_06910 [Spirochaetaceae bacterium]|nr:hypothetical protein [Spirochaetaceae bacterium]
MSMCRVNTAYRRLCYRRNVLSQGGVRPLDATDLGSQATEGSRRLTVVFTRPER